MKTEIQISDDQNQITINGLVLNFYPVKRVKKTHCCHCFLMRGVPEFRCEDVPVPCRKHERKDKMDGVFSIHEMPKKGGNNE